MCYSTQVWAAHTWFAHVHGGRELEAAIEGDLVAQRAPGQGRGCAR